MQENPRWGEESQDAIFNTKASLPLPMRLFTLEQNSGYFLVAKEWAPYKKINAIRKV